MTLRDILRSMLIEAHPTISNDRLEFLIGKYLEAAKWGSSD